MERPSLHLAYLFTTFPKSTETFLQREITAMRSRGVHLTLYSLWGGGPSFEGLPVHTFNKWRLLTLLWIIPAIAVEKPRFFFSLVRGLCTRRAPSWINFWENMLGAGFAALFRAEFRGSPRPWVHAAWGGAPATAAWCLSHLEGVRFSSGAHAYDIYEYGGDWWLNEKLAEAAFIHTSTAMAKHSLMARGLPGVSIEVIHRGLAELPFFRPLRPDRSTLNLVCVARLVEKKGLFHQLRIYQALREAGVSFQAVILGDGPLRGPLQTEIERLGLGAQVRLLGHQPQTEVWTRLSEADALLHTGVVAASGDRDGLPNVIPEAMAAGVLVVTSPAAATTEAIQAEVTGWVAEVEEPQAWVRALRELQNDQAKAERLRQAARAWVEEHFDAHRNAARLYSLFEYAARS